MDSLDISGDHHICIRCKQTIAGLDAYVNHRKSGNCEPISAHKFFNCLQLQCKYKDICGDNEEEVDDEEDGEDERSVRSDTTDPNQSYDNSDDEVSDEDIYRPPNDFTGIFAFNDSVFTVVVISWKPFICDV